MDPRLTESLIVGAMAGGIGSGFAKHLTEAGLKKLSSFWSPAAAQESLETNGLEMLVLLEERMSAMERASAFGPDFLGEAFKHPSFNVLLQKAIVAAGQTSSREKHGLLARLVAERLGSDAESTVALASQSACEAIAQATSLQLAYLGAHYAITGALPSDVMFTSVDHARADFERYCQVLAICTPQEISELDVNHLSAIGCVTQGFVSNNMLGRFVDRNWLVSHPTNRLAVIDRQSNSFSMFKRIWDRYIQTARITSVGRLVGLYVYDVKTSSTTDVSVWAARIDDPRMQVYSEYADVNHRVTE